MVKRAILGWLARRGIRVITRNDPRFHRVPKNVEPEFLSVFEACSPFTMTSFECQYGLWRAARYVVRGGVKGDFVECGVYRGGSVMTAAMTFEQCGDRTRSQYLYDTFEGMTDPEARDVDFAGRTPHEHLRTWSVGRISDMANSPIEEVRRNVLSTGVASERCVFVTGKVEDTIPGTVPPGPISILRLDTDWHASTLHEMIHLFPLLAPGGVLIVDDYGMWRGARDAVDEYFAREGIAMLLNRLDAMGAVVGVKP